MLQYDLPYSSSRCLYFTPHEFRGATVLTIFYSRTCNFCHSAIFRILIKHSSRKATFALLLFYYLSAQLVLSFAILLQCLFLHAQRIRSTIFYSKFSY